MKFLITLHFTFITGLQSRYTEMKPLFRDKSGRFSTQEQNNAMKVLLFSGACCPVGNKQQHRLCFVFQSFPRCDCFSVCHSVDCYEYFFIVSPSAGCVSAVHAPPFSSSPAPPPWRSAASPDRSAVSEGADQETAPRPLRYYTHGNFLRMSAAHTLFFFFIFSRYNFFFIL